MVLWDCIVVGAGTAGVGAARALHDSGLSVLVLEASFHLGGRVRAVRERELAACPAPTHAPWMQLHLPDREAASTMAAAGGELLGEGDYVFECGAEFLHGERTSLFELAAHHGSGARQLFSWAQGDGGPSERAAPDGGAGYYFTGGALHRFDAAGDHAPALAQLHALLWALADLPLPPPTSRRSVAAYLRDAGTPPPMMALAAAGYANTVGAASLSQLSLRHTILAERTWAAAGAGAGGEHDYRTRMSELLAAEAAGLTIRRQVQVLALRHGDDGDASGGLQGGAGGVAGGGSVDVRVRGEETPLTSLRARRVVLTVPVSVLGGGGGSSSSNSSSSRSGGGGQGDGGGHSTIAFDPPLPPAKRSAIASLHLSAGAKVLLKFGRRFWPADCHGCICAEAGPVPEFWFDTVRGVGRDVLAGEGGGGAAEEEEEAAAAAAAGQQCHYVTAFLMGDNATRLCALPVDAAVDGILQQLGTVFCGGGSGSSDAAEEPRQAYLGAVRVDWSKEPFTRGAYTCCSVNEPAGARAELAQPVGGRLFFAGEATMPGNPLTAHAAYDSGRRAAAEVARSLQTKPARL